MSTLGLGPLAVAVASPGYASVSSGGRKLQDNGYSPGPGCSSTQTDNTSSTSVSVSGPFGMGGANAGTSSENQQDHKECAPDNDSTAINISRVDRDTTIDNSTMIMTKNSMKVLSESTNQMIVNSVTATKNVSTQNVDLKQVLKITVANVKGNVDIRNVRQQATIDMSNVAQMSLTAFDNVRTDLATQVLNTFKSSINQETLDKMQADISTQTQTEQASAIKARVTADTSQVTKTDLPVAQPAPLPQKNIGANTHQMQFNSNDIHESTKLIAPYSNTTDISRSKN